MYHHGETNIVLHMAGMMCEGGNAEIPKNISEKRDAGYIHVEREVRHTP
jgi:hypothetical protein